MKNKEKTVSGQIVQWLMKHGKDGKNIACVNDDNFWAVIFGYVLAANQSLLVVVPDLKQAEFLTNSLQVWGRFLSVDVVVDMLPETLKGELFTPELEAQRSRFLYSLLDDVGPRVVVATVAGALSTAPTIKEMREQMVTLRVGEEYSTSDLLTAFQKFDFDDEEIVSLHGDYSHRGGILDVFSPSHDSPVRIDFWGDEIDSLKLFSVQNQRSIEDVDSYVVIPRVGLGVENEGDLVGLWNSLSDVNVLFCNADELMHHADRFTDKSDVLRALIESEGEALRVTDLDEGHEEQWMKPGVFSALAHVFSGHSEYEELGRELLQESVCEQIRQWLDTGYKMYVVSFESSHNIVLEWFESNHISLENVEVVSGEIKAGVIIPELKCVVLNEKELFAVERRILSQKVAEETIKKEAFASYVELEPGDHAVHLTHGVCQFKGLVHVDERDAGMQEALELEFADDVVMHVPLWQVNLVNRYVGAQKTRPVLSKIGGKRWSKVKIDAQRGVKELAAEMLRMQAVRSALEGYQYDRDDVYQAAFDAAFPYVETPDQLKAIQDVKRDMERSQPMDRLICGDVGYGKTEVAMRAAFKAVMSGKQVVVLVPTTVLAQQHYYNFLDRFAEFPVVVEMLSRFKSKKEQNEILAKVEEGVVDIVVGTHRLVQGDVKFSDLGLVVIDEEQRFGVKHKERLKHMRMSVDILTMTATPIPRTLYMGMAGLRDMSTIITAPQKRLAVKSMVAKFDDQVIKSAIETEVQRGGQVFFLHNRVKTIHEIESLLISLLPDVRFAVGHGQMDEHELEAVMGRFLEGKIDVLISTTIVESGLDVPNANTIIIDRADRFGLAELYQLRGRVGRSTRQAYAYFLLPKSEIVTGDAKKRIAAIRKYTQLGAGFRLALRDLEIRGAGNLLGSQQSGHINNIGFELYCQMLRSMVAQLEGKVEESDIRQVSVSLDFCRFSEPATGFVSVCVPVGYIPFESQRIDFNRRIAAAVTLDELVELRDEARDRYGELPVPVENLLAFRRVAVLAASLKAYSLTVADRVITMETEKGLYKVNGRLPEIPEKGSQNILFRLEKILAEISKNTCK